MKPIDQIGARAHEIADGGAERPKSEKAGGGSFGSLIEKTIDETERLQDQADGMVKGLAQGEITDVHEVMLAMSRADLSFRMVLEVRNKLLDAYQEVMRMQV